MEDKALRVLLVEDDPDDTFLLQEMLRETGTPVELSHAERLAEALSLGGQDGFDAVLLDLSLPDSKGLTTFLDLHDALPETPVVVLTGLEDETVATRAVHEGAQDYLFKGQVSGPLLVRSLRYAMERQRTTHYRALLNERERFDTAVSQMSDGILVTAGDWRITNANRAAELLLNLPADGWRGLSLPQALQPFAVSEPLADLISSHDQATAFEISRQETHPPLFIEARLSRLFDTAGELVSTILVLRDVTNDRLSRHIQAEFMTAAPHKLRTPLAVLLGYLTVMKSLGPRELAARWPRMSQVWEMEVRHLADVVQKLLDFEALGTTGLAPELPRTDVARVVDQVCEKVRRRYPSRRLDLNLQMDPETERAEASPGHLGFILEELLDNAVKFNDKEAVRADIKVTREAPEWLRFSVQDNGPGIPHEYYDRIFEDFMQVEEHVTGQVPGWGIGLRMARQVTEAYGGSISVTSEISVGSTFSFTLPAVMVSDALREANAVESG